MIRYGSVCSGIEAASVAWHLLGWQPAFFSEIERFPCEVLAHHYGSNLPGEELARNGVPNLGDITKFMEWPDAAIDVLVGGTPCQSFSVAGLRAGLADPRGNLMLTYLAIAARYRPRWLVWENVPGVLSSGDGRDFGTFLQGLGELGYGFAYRVLDAQYIRVGGFGRAVPQRRRRVFVVGYLGDWRRAAAVFFDGASLRGDPAPRREAGQGIAAPTRPSAAFGGGNTSGCIDVAAALAAHGRRQDFEVETFVAQPAAPNLTGNPYGDHESREGLLVAHALRAEGFDASEDGTGRGTPLVPVDITNGLIGGAIAGTLDHAQHKSNRGLGVMAPAIAQTLTRGAESAGKGGYAGRRQEDDVNLVARPIAFDARQSDAVVCGDKAGPLDTDAFSQAVAFVPEVAATMVSRSSRGGGQTNSPGHNADQELVAMSWAVRRLTPLECERLQGFPDGYTLIPRGSKLAADGPRYKALGNSMAINCMRWIGERIALVDAMTDSEAEEAA